MIGGIYASNLHHGGGASGAAAFIGDLPTLWQEGHLEGFEGLIVEASKTVAGSISNLEVVRKLPKITLIIRDDRPSLHFMLKSQICMDAQFVVRGPHYARRVARRTVLGFADGTMAFPPPRGIPESSAGRLRLSAKNVLKRRLLARYEGYIVQTERLAARLSDMVGDVPVSVIPNSPSHIFSAHRPTETKARAQRGAGHVTLVYPARGYAHKNHELIGAVGDLLQKEGIDLEVIVTLRGEEFSGLSERTRAYCRNVGEQRLDELVALYATADACFFPSLNETASATPLEALAMGLPVIASDRAFVRDMSVDVPFYFEPTDSSDAARAVAEFVMTGDAALAERIAEGASLIRSLPSPIERSRLYIDVLKGEL